MAGLVVFRRGVLAVVGEGWGTVGAVDLGVGFLVPSERQPAACKLATSQAQIVAGVRPSHTVK